MPAFWKVGAKAPLFFSPLEKDFLSAVILVHLFLLAKAHMLSSDLAIDVKKKWKQLILIFAGCITDDLLIN